LRQRKAGDRRWAYNKKVKEPLMAHQQLEAGLTVAEVLDRWPQTIPVFIRHRMACVGCTIAPFETLSEVADIYQLEPDEFLQELQQLIDRKEERAAGRL
jgi:hybrid cluster-associated redox disulfide protein